MTTNFEVLGHLQLAMQGRPDIKLTVKEWRERQDGEPPSQRNAYYLALPADIAMKLIEDNPDEEAWSQVEGVQIIDAPA